MAFLLAGGAGYIGSHTAVELLTAGKEIVIADNFSNSSPAVIDRIEQITGKRPKLYCVDVAKRKAIQQIFSENDIEAVVHFAGFKAVKESVDQPLQYYRNNLDTTLTLLECMDEFGTAQFIFSSSATVYGNPQRLPLTEDMPTLPVNPYGQTKVMIEQILKDQVIAKPRWSVVLLRYFNPVGAHPSGLIGEVPNGTPNNLMPYIAKVAAGELEKVHVYGDDYPTKDGTGMRDYIHVVDLAKGHIAALDFCKKNNGLHVFNLGTGKAYSVLEMIAALKRASGREIPYVIEGRRSGDVATCYASTEKANQILGWQAEKTLQDMCNDTWRWQNGNGKQEKKQSV